MRMIDEEALADITLGATVLGSGGGGDPYLGWLLSREAIRKHGPVPLVDLDDVPDDANLAFIAGMGAPGALLEKIPRAAEYERIIDETERHTGRRLGYVVPAEAGGLNAVTPFASAAPSGLPVVDADAMGRAFPKLEMVTPTLFGGSTTPLVMVDEHYNTICLSTSSNVWAESLTRAAAVASGASATMALYPMTGAQAKQWLLRGTLTKAQALGRVIREARAGDRSPVTAVLENQNGILLFAGKVEAVERRTEKGWTSGVAEVQGMDWFASQRASVHFQNEYLAFAHNGVFTVTSPDLIMALEIDSAEPIPAEEIKYGYRVAIIGMPCEPLWRTEAGLALTGPRQFGFDVDYTPVEALDSSVGTLT